MALQSINPFAGTDLESFWQQGFAVAFMSPDTDHTPPSPLTPEAQDAWTQGATAGEVATGIISVPPTSFDETGDWGKVAEIGAHGAIEAGHFVYEVFQAATSPQVVTLAAVGRLALGGSLFLVMGLIFTGALTGEEVLDPATTNVLGTVRDKLASAGIVDTIDLFMPVCDQSSHGLGTSDALLANGFWHGHVFLSFDEAVNEGRSHEHPGSVRVVHVQSTTPDLVEVIDMP